MQSLPRVTGEVRFNKEGLRSGSVEDEIPHVIHRQNIIIKMLVPIATMIVIVVIMAASVTVARGMDVGNEDGGWGGRQEVRVPFTVRDIDATQLIGTFENLEVPSTGTSRCADFIRVGQVEPLQTDVGVLYVLPHRFISLPQEGGGEAQCIGTAVDSPVTQESATVLRRDDQITLDRNSTLIDAFALAGERFFIGVEIGDRVCGLTRLPNGSPSMWMAPGREIAVAMGSAGFIIRFVPGRKYAVFFDEVDPCVFSGDAREAGVPTAASSASPSISPAPQGSPAPSILPPSGDDSSGAPESSGPQSDSFVPPRTSFGFSPVSGLPPERVCFPASAFVALRRGESRLISDIQLGDVVATAAKFNYQHRHHDECTVIGFTHRDANARTWMVKLHVITNETLVLSAGHYIYISRHEHHHEHRHQHQNQFDRCYLGDDREDCREGLLLEYSDSSKQSARWRRKLELGRADNVQVGDSLVLGIRRELVPVSRIESVFVKGLYNPQTTCGDLIVDGFLASTYTAAVGAPLTGHALMAPWRASDRLLSSFGMANWWRLSIASASYRLYKR